MFWTLLYNKFGLHVLDSYELKSVYEAEFNKIFIGGVKMKLAEALILRADLQKELMSLKNRINQNLLVQEGEKPSENPYTLYDEILLKVSELEGLILKINKTNSNT